MNVLDVHRNKKKNTKKKNQNKIQNKIVTFVGCRDKCGEVFRLALPLDRVTRLWKGMVLGRVRRLGPIIGRGTVCLHFAKTSILGSVKSRDRRYVSI